MKTSTIIILLISCFTFSSQAQSINDQTKELQNIKKGAYTAYLTHKNGDQYIGGINDLHHEVTDIKDYRVKPGTHQEVYLIKNKNPQKPKELRPDMLVPDNEAFPATYIFAAYEGNKKLMKDIGYTIREHSGYGSERVVFLEGKIYLIKDWKSKDDYTLHAVLEHTNKPLKGIKLMKEVYKTRKKMKKEQPDAKLQKYLDQAFTKQREIYETWILNPKNSAFIDKKEEIAQNMKNFIKKDREEYLKSDEYKRIMANNNSGTQSGDLITVQNKLGKDIYVYQEGSRNGTPVRAGGRSTFDCKKTYYYSTSGKADINGNGLRFYSANSSCGGTVEIK